MRPLLTVLAAAVNLLAHAPILPPIQGPLTTRGRTILDGNGESVLLRGVSMPGLDVLDAPPGSLDARTVAGMTGPAFGVIRVRWNLNTVRLPVSIRVWRRDGAAYLDRVASIVRLANDRELAVVLAAYADSRLAGDGGLPDAAAVEFWRAWASRFRDNPRVVFSVFNRPSARTVPGAEPARRTEADWRFWRDGGALSGGARAVGMQELVDAVRSTGAQQLVAVSSFHDPHGFAGLTDAAMVRGANLLYETEPDYLFGLTDDARAARFGFLGSRVPVYAGEWGIRLTDAASCAALPRDPQQATTVVLDTVVNFENRGVSWTASGFQPGELVRDFEDYLPTQLDRPWTCGQNADPPQGMGEAVVLLTTGDPTGFGALRAEQVANAAGGPASPLAPGQLVSLYVEQLGPLPGQSASLAADGSVAVNLAGTEVRFGGIAAPLLYASAFQINAQVPYQLRPGSNATVQVLYQGVPSNRIVVPVVDAAPELFHDIATRYALALNQDGSRNGAPAPAEAGSVVVLFASGGGQTSPVGATGLPAPSPHPTLTLPAEVTVDGRPADVLFAGEVPGFVGLVQVNARLAGFAGATARAAPVSIRVAGRASRAAVLLWVR